MNLFKNQKHMQKLVLFPIFMILSMCNPPGDITKQKNAIGSFYNVIIAKGFSEIPDSSHHRLIKPYISMRLQKLLIEAFNAENVKAAEETEPGPPLIEGSLFTSLFEGADSLIDIKVDSSAQNTFLVELEYKNTAANPGPDTAFTWNDRVYLIKENGTWVIDDIELLGNWDFARKTSVSSILKSVISMK